eukprot:m.292385 g.292385  ORF g.292385 m.292385 type:complete len:496 (+) comp20000_c0_seq1:85-1572(+)
MAAMRVPVRVPREFPDGVSTTAEELHRGGRCIQSKAQNFGDSHVDVLGVVAPPQCTFLVRGKRRCKRFVSVVTDDQRPGQEVCTEHTDEALRIARSVSQPASCSKPSQTSSIEVFPPSRAKAKPRVSSSQKRMRNPLSVQQLDLEVCDNVIQHFSFPYLPVVVDIGSAQGKFLCDLVRKNWHHIQDRQNTSHIGDTAFGEQLEETPSVLQEGIVPVSVLNHFPPQVLASPASNTVGAPALFNPSACNYLGVELRDWCVAAANGALSNDEAQVLQFVTASAHNTLAVLLASIRRRADEQRTATPKSSSCPGVAEQVHGRLCVPAAPMAGVLQGVTIQFPDPWVKAKCVRRRILQPDMARLIVTELVPGGFLYVSTDCPHMAVDMERVMARYCHAPAPAVIPAREQGAVDAMALLDIDPTVFTGSSDDDELDTAPTAAVPASQAVVPCMVRVVESTEQRWLARNPLRVPSERESVSGELGRAVYRALYIKTRHTCAD